MKKAIVCLAFMSALSLLADTAITVETQQKGLPINYLLAGVSQGGNAGSYFKPAIRQQLDALAPKLVRIEMITNSQPHNLYNPETKTFDWSKLDQEIEAVQQQGGEVIINLFGTPSHLVSDPAAKTPAFTPPADFQAYADFCAEIVRHVNIDKKYNVKLWEFWNEPSGGWFWSTWREKSGSESFWQLYAMVARTIKAIDPNIQIGTLADNIQYPEHYRNLFRYLKQNPAPLDFLTVHYYGDWSGKTLPSPESYVIYTDRLAEIAKQELGTVPPIYLTEWNLVAESNGKYTAAQTAGWIGSSLCRMQTSGKINGAALFRIEPYRDPYSSLFGKNGEIRVPARVLKYFTELPVNGIVCTSSSPDIVIVAGKDNRQTALLISRFNIAEGAQNAMTKIAVKQLRLDTKYQITIRREDSATAAQNGDRQGEITELKSDPAGTLRLELQMEPCSVAFITIK